MLINQMDFGFTQSFPNAFTVNPSDASLLLTLGYSNAQVNSIINLGYYSNPGTALQVLLLKHRAAGYNVLPGNSQTGVYPRYKLASISD